MRHSSSFSHPRDDGGEESSGHEPGAPSSRTRHPPLTSSSAYNHISVPHLGSRRAGGTELLERAKCQTFKKGRSLMNFSGHWNHGKFGKLDRPMKGRVPFFSNKADTISSCQGSIFASTFFTVFLHGPDIARFLLFMNC